MALKSIKDPEVDSRVQSTVSTVILLVNSLPPSAVAELIGLNTGEVMRILILVQSLLLLNEENSNYSVKPFHKSFPDFITDPSRCPNLRFYISPGTLHH